MSRFKTGTHLFQKAGITPTLGLIWVFMFGWRNKPRPGRCPAEAKPGRFMKVRRKRGPLAGRTRCGVKGCARVTITFPDATRLDLWRPVGHPMWLPWTCRQWFTENYPDAL